MPSQQEIELSELRQRIRHSASHVMADVVTKMFPDVKLAIGPPTDDGFYYDFLAENPFTTEDLEKIERRMAETVKQDLPFEYREYPREQALSMHAEEPMKLEIIGEIPEDHHVHHTCENRLCVNPEHLKAVHNPEHQTLHRKPKEIM